MVPLIGITGPARHGKDTVGRMLLERLPYFKRFAFADAFKLFGKAAFSAQFTEDERKEGEQLFRTSRAQLIRAATGFLHEARGMFPVEEENADINLLIGILEAQHMDYQFIDGEISFVSSWRHLWQILGTDWARSCIHENYWIDPFLPESYAVVTDVRGHGDRTEKELVNNEAIAIIKRGGIVIRVVDPRKQGTAIRAHVSEAGIAEEYITHTIVNDGTIEDLQRSVVDFMYAYLFDTEQVHDT